jgi:hypothetical protein
MRRCHTHKLGSAGLKTQGDTREDATVGIDALHHHAAGKAHTVVRRVVLARAW